MSPNQPQAPSKHLSPVIILTGGGSGGHITPLLSLAHALKIANPKCKIVYIGLKGEKVEGLQSRYQIFDQVCFVSAGKFRRYHGQSLVAHLTDIKTLFLNARDFFKVVAGLLQAKKLIRIIKPDVVFSKGGYVAVPVGVAARINKIPIITHDSDSTPGLANRIIGRWAKVHATGMPAKYYNYPQDSIAYTGIPVDERIAKVSAALQKMYREELGLPVSGRVLLAAGGGQGSQQINELMLTIAPQLLTNGADIHLIHIVGGSIKGQASAEEIRRQYKQSLSAADFGRVKILGFTSDFYKYSAAADLIITRAGATALAEFALQSKACIVIPSSVLSAGHQLKNARQLKDADAAEVLPADVGGAQLLKTVTRLLDSTAERIKLAGNLEKMANPEASKLLANLILEQAEDNQS